MFSRLSLILIINNQLLSSNNKYFKMYTIFAASYYCSYVKSCFVQQDPSYIPMTLLQAAMIAGLISRMIFVYPSWDKGDNTTFAITTAEIGTLHMNNSKEPTFCCCMFVASVGKQQCMHLDKSDGEDSDRNSDMDVMITDSLDDCKVGLDNNIKSFDNIDQCCHPIIY